MHPRPILAVIPALPAALLWPLLALALLAGLFLTLRNFARRPALAGGGAEMAPSEPPSAMLTPLAGAAVLSVLLWVWSRNDITLHSYGFFLVLGFLLATWNACLEARRRGYDPNLILDLALPMLATTVIMCRVLYVVLNLRQFHSFPEMLRVWGGGLSFHGIVPGSLMVVGYYSWTRKIPFGTLADLLAPSVFLGYAFGRLGCFFNGCCYGGACDLPWAVQFPDEANRSLWTLPSHPTQLYSTALALLLFGAMQRAKVSPRFTRFPGQLTLLFFGLYCIERAFIEIFRNGATARTVFGTTWLTQAQLASAIGLVVIAALWSILGRRIQGSTAPPAATPSPQSLIPDP